MEMYASSTFAKASVKNMSENTKGKSDKYRLLLFNQLLNNIRPHKELMAIFASNIPNNRRSLSYHVI